MSHFNVMAINEYETNMERYCEELEVDPYIHLTYDELVSKGREYIEADAADKLCKAICDGTNEEDWGNMVREMESTKAYHHEFTPEEMHAKWEDCLKQASRVKRYLAGEITDAELHDYAVDANDYECDKDGNAITTYNPDSKWDWYVEGGRWSGELILTKAAAERLGSKTANSALVKDIDWSRMYSLSEEERQHAIDFWNYYVMEKPYPGTKEEFEKKFGFFHYKREYMKDKYKSLGGYLSALSNWSTHAVLDDGGNWHEVGEMGWFGISSEENDEALSWANSFYNKFIKPLPYDTLITILDCHI